MSKRWISSVCILAVLALAVAGCETIGDIMPGAKEKTPALVMRINCGAAEPYTDNAENLWAPDQLLGEGERLGNVDGMTVDRGELNITGTDAPKIYQTERYSMTEYKFAVPEGKYTIRLHFAETYDGITDEGQRVFSVTMNGKTVLQDFDVWKEAGGFQKPVVKEFKGVAAVDGALAIGFVPNIQNPEINGIEIIVE
ncbi:MAG: malectin [Phycisphaerales bacterium]|nr:MAG: malectin [Phycisphaerales bacterium]